MSKLINELITILSATNQLLEVEQRQSEFKLKTAAMYDGSNLAIATKLRTEALAHQERAEEYYKTISLISDRIYGEKEIINLKITDKDGNTLSKDAKTEVSPLIKDENIAKVVEELKGKSLEYPEDEANVAIYHAFNDEADKEKGMESAIRKAEYFFGDLIEARCKEDKKLMKAKIASNPENEEIINTAKATFKLRKAKHTRLIAKDKIRKGQLEYVKSCREEVKNAADASKVIVIKSPQDIINTKYWIDGKFNYRVFDGGSDEKTEDLLKLEVIHKHLIGKRDEAVALVRAYYKDLGWDTLKAQEFVYALLNQENPHTHTKEAAKGFVVAGLSKQKGLTGKKAKDAYKKGIDQAKKMLKAWLRTDEIDGDNNPVYMVTEKKLNEMLDEVIADAKASFNAA
jgi:hypothetical protein